MTITTTTKRSVAAVAAMTAVSTLAACGSGSTNESAAPKASASTPSATSSASATPSSQPSTTKQAKQDDTKRASRSQSRSQLTTTTVNQVQSVAPETRYVYSDKLPKGVAKVTRAGVPGQITVTYRQQKSGAKVVSSEQVGVKIDKYALRKVVTIGTAVKEAPKPAAKPAVKPAVKVAPKPVVKKQAPVQVSRTQVRKAVTAPVQKPAPKPVVKQEAPKPVVKRVAPKPAPKPVVKKQETPKSSNAPVSGSPNAAFWKKVSSCESNGNWAINTGNGFYGGLQFTQQSWVGAGGLAYAPRADLATPAQQMAIADKLLAIQGPGAWPVCSR